MKTLDKYKIRIIGPSGTGKSFFHKKLKELGYNAVDGDFIADLCYFYDIKTDTYEKNYPGKEMVTGAEWHWNLERLQEFLSKNPRIIILGNCDNQKDSTISSRFDYTFYLDVPMNEIMKNLLNEGRYEDGQTNFGKTQNDREEIKKYALRFYKELNKDWIPLTARDDAKKLVKEIEDKIGHKLEK